MLKDKDPELKYFFLGDTDETLSALTKKATEEFASIVVKYFPRGEPKE